MFTLGATRWRDYGVVGDGPRLVRVDFACGCRVHHWATEAGRIDPLPCCSHSAELGLPLRGHGCGGPSELGFQLDLGEVARAAFTDPDPKEQAKLNPRLAELARAIVVGAACDEPEQACGEELLGLSSWVVEPASDREGRADQLIAVAEAIASPESRAAAAPVPVVESLVARRTRRMLAEREPHGERFWRRKEALGEHPAMALPTGRRGTAPGTTLWTEPAAVYIDEAAVLEGFVSDPPRDLIGIALHPAAPRLLREIGRSLRSSTLLKHHAQYLALREGGLDYPQAVEAIGKKRGESAHIALQAKMLRRLRKMHCALQNPPTRKHFLRDVK